MFCTAIYDYATDTVYVFSLAATVNVAVFVTAVPFAFSTLIVKVAVLLCSASVKAFTVTLLSETVISSFASVVSVTVTVVPFFATALKSIVVTALPFTASVFVAAAVNNATSLAINASATVVASGSYTFVVFTVIFLSVEALVMAVEGVYVTFP